MTKGPLFAALAASLAVAGCATAPLTGPVEVTRYHQSAEISRLGQGTIFIENAPGEEGQSLELSPYKAAIAAELAALGYRETSREEASQIAQLRVDRYVQSPAEQRRGPVSVGVGGSTGSYGSGVGLGVGINLGGSKARDMIGTDLGVMIRDKTSSDVLWEGRASLSVSDNSPFASSSASATAIADALFLEFPGNNGETIEVRVKD